MKYFFSSLPLNSANEMYSILGHCDGYLYLRATHPSCKIYRKRIFDVYGWKKMKDFVEMDNHGYECVCATLIPSRQCIVMLTKNTAEESLMLCCYSLETGEMKVYKCASNFEGIYPFNRAIYQFHFNNNSQIRCYPTKLFFDDNDTLDFPFIVFNLDHQPATAHPHIDFGLIFHDDIEDYQSISNICFITPTILAYQYIKSGSQHYCRIDLEKLSASQDSSTADEKGFVKVDRFNGAIKVYGCETFYKHVHHYVRVNGKGNIEFYNLEGMNGIIKGEVKLNDDGFICKESTSKQIFYEDFLDMDGICSYELFFDDQHVFISTPQYFITGYQMVRTLKDIAYLSLLPKMDSKELLSLSLMHQFIGFIENDPPSINE